MFVIDKILQMTERSTYCAQHRGQIEIEGATSCAVAPASDQVTQATTATGGRTLCHPKLCELWFFPICGAFASQLSRTGFQAATFARFESTSLLIS